MAADGPVTPQGMPTPGASAREGADSVYLLGLRLAGRRVVVAGGGGVADRRVPALVRAGADVVLVSPSATAGLESLAIAGQLRWERRRYTPGDIDGAWLVHACTNDRGVNAAIAAACSTARVWCVRADDRNASTAWTPASGQAGDTRIAVLTGDPVRSAGVRDALVSRLRDGSIDVRRGRVVSREPPGPAGGREHREGGPRVRAYRGAGADGGARAGTDRGAGADGGAGAGAGRRAAAHDSAGTYRGARLPGVALVGGGPGDPGLITVRGRQLLADAEVVVTDRLAPRSLLDELPPDVEIIDAAKIPYGRAMAQDHINAALIENALAGRFVVRLKGGDPFVFGRGAEEVLACARAGVPVTVVPGVTSATAVPAAAFVPVTHRGLTQQFHVVSAHVAPGDERSTIDWAALGRSTGTIVLLMAVERLGAIADTLIRHGRVSTTPVTVIQDGTLPTQHTVTATLGTVADQAAATGIRPPAVVVVGEVVNIAAQIEELLPGRQRWIGRS